MKHCLCVPARVHTPRPGGPRPLRVAAELVEDDVEPILGAYSDAASAAPAQGSAAGVIPSTQNGGHVGSSDSSGSSGSDAAAAKREPPPPRTLLNDIMNGKVSELDVEAPTLQLPQTLDEYLAAGGLESIVSECFALLRMDFPLIALRRLLLVEPLELQAGGAPLRERSDESDPRLADILRVERELEPTLRESTEGDWTLIASKKQFQVQTFLRMGDNGRANVKVVGTIPHKLSSCIAPLLHPELMPTWLPGVGTAEKLGQASNFRFQVYIRSIRIPVPFLAQRDAVVTGYGDIYSPTSIMAYITSEVPVYPEGEPRAGERRCRRGSRAHGTLGRICRDTRDRCRPADAHLGEYTARPQDEAAAARVDRLVHEARGGPADTDVAKAGVKFGSGKLG